MHACGRGNHCRNFTCWRQRDENRRTYCLNPRRRTPIDSSPVRHSFDRSRALPPQLNSSRRTRLAKSNRKTKTTATTTTTTKEVAENQNHHIPGTWYLFCFAMLGTFAEDRDSHSPTDTQDPALYPLPSLSCWHIRGGGGRGAKQAGQRLEAPKSFSGRGHLGAR